MSIWIAEFQFDEGNLDELWDHRITDEDVLSVFDRDEFVVLANKKRASGTHKMVGRDWRGRLITIVLEPVSRRDGVWRPVTGYYPSNAYETRKWRDRYG